jgi:hypothetical protein
MFKLAAEEKGLQFKILYDGFIPENLLLDD